MADFLRIIDRFRITGRGIAYTCIASKNSVFRFNDELLDLQGNRFVITGFEMFRRLPEYSDSEDMPLGILIKGIDAYEACGDYFVRSLSDINFIYCSDPLKNRYVDEDFLTEYETAKQTHSCALFSYEDLEDGRLRLCGDAISGLTIYRGWMMNPELYKKFYSLLEEKNIVLINNPEEYSKYHLLPGWYDDFKNDTPESVWTDNDSVDEALKSAKTLEGACVVKDYVKSRKHEWYDACYIKDILDSKNASTVIRNFVERQDDDLVGGIVIRKFEDLNQIGYHEKSGMPISEEFRVFIYAGSILGISNYWQQGNISISADELDWIRSLSLKVKSNFATMDLARKTDGSLIIMEFGDGQVSGLQGMDVERFYNGFNGYMEVSYDVQLLRCSSKN